jgi:hypothetical protein
VKLAALVLALALMGAATPAEAWVAHPYALPACTVHVMQPDAELVEDVIGLDRERWTSPEIATEAWLLSLLSGSLWPEYLWDDVTAIAECESRFRPWAVGDDGRAVGLMQIRTDVHPGIAHKFDLYTASENLSAAWVVYLEAGKSFKPWACWEREK